MVDASKSSEGTPQGDDFMQEPVERAQENLVDGVDCARPSYISCHDRHDEGDILLTTFSETS